MVREVLAAGTVLLCLVVSLQVRSSETGIEPGEAWEVVAAGLPAVVLLARRHHPVASVAACAGLLASLAFAGGDFALGPLIALLVAVFGASNRFARRGAVMVTVVTVIALMPAAAYAESGNALDPRGLQLGLMIALAAAGGDATRSRREFIEAIRDRALKAEQSRDVEAQRRVTEERLRLARDLHDTVAHQIAVISLNAGVASSAMDSRPKRAQEALTTIRSASRTVLHDIGALLEVLRNDDDDAARAPRPGLDRVPALVQAFRDSGHKVSLDVDGDVDLTRDTAVGAVAYLVTQEALTNAHKHGTGSTTNVRLTIQPHEVAVTVTNPLPEAGARSSPATGYGLVGIHERVAASRGRFTAGPDAENNAWTARAVLPLTSPPPQPRSAKAGP